MGPLHGVKVIEVGGIGPGPFCGMMLSDMGAEIVRVERKGQFVLEEGDRIFNPSRETARLLQKAAKIGPKTEELGRLFLE